MRGAENCFIKCFYGKKRRGLARHFVTRDYNYSKGLIMTNVLRAVIVLLFFSIFQCNVSHAAKAINGIGVEFAIYDAASNVNFAPGQVATLNTPAETLRMSVGLYNLNSAKVVQELAAMRAAGATDIALPIWLDDFNNVDTDGFVDWVNAYLIDDGTGSLRPQHRQNLINIIQNIKTAGFKRIILRFNGYFRNDNAWDEAAYQKIWNFIYNTRNLVDVQLNGGATTVLYDLFGEGAGYDSGNGVRKQFVKRLWTDYNVAFGPTKTVGFSYAWSPGRFAAMEQWYAEVGTARPEAYAFDIYPTTAAQAASSLQAISTEMGDQNGKPILITETWFNDVDTGTGISNALNGTSSVYNMNLDGLFHWQLIKSRSMQNLDMNWSHDAINAMTSTTQMSAYRSLLAKRRADITNKHSSLFVLTDSSCATTSTTTCSVNEKWAAPPVGKSVGISVSVDGAAETEQGCGHAVGTQIVPWIVPGHSYRFIIRYQTSCVVTSAPPDAESTIVVAATSQP
jgi:hypothetical protein